MKTRLALLGVLSALAIFPVGGGEGPPAPKGPVIDPPTGLSRMWTGAMLPEQKGWTRVPGDPTAWGSTD